MAFDPGAAVVLDAGAGAERAQVALVSANFFSALGVSPILGRTFDSDADSAPGAHPVAVLSYTAWQRLFSGNPEVVGRTLRLNGQVFTIIGVAPRDFSGLMRGVFPSLFVPVSMLGQVRPSWTARPLTDPNHAWLAITARLPMDTSVEQAAEAASASARSLSGTTRALTLAPGSRGRGESVQALASSAMLFSAAAVVLLNHRVRQRVGPLPGQGRGAPARVRHAACPWRQSLAPHQTFAGRDPAHHTARWSTRPGLGQRSGPRVGTHGADGSRRSRDRHSHVRRRVASDAGHDGNRRLGPRTARGAGSTLGSLKNRAAATSGWRHVSWQHGLVVAQLGLSLAALVVAGLCLRSGARLAAVDTGIDDSNVVLATFDASAAGYSRTNGVLFYESLRERVAALPGFASASLTHLVPFEGRSDSRTLGVPGYTPAPGEDMNVAQNWVGPDYFATVRVRLLGAGVSAHGSCRGARSRRGQRDAGASFLAGSGSRWQDALVRGRGDTQIIGLVKDHRARTPAEQPRPMIYLPYLQTVRGSAHARSPREPRCQRYAMAIRDAARSLDPALAPYNLRTLATEKDRSLAGARHTTEISSVFGVLCLIVSAVGLYGVLAQAVARRTREIALRIALGGAGLPPSVWSCATPWGWWDFALIPGLGSAFVAGRLLSDMLYESAAIDVPTAAAAVAFLTIAALIAAWRPARWAAKVDPIVALREE